MILSIIFVGSIISLIAVYLIGIYNERYWKRKGVKFYSKNKVSGILWDFFTKKGAMFERFGELYNEFKNEPAVGIGSFGTPTLFVIDPKNVRHVLQADFNSFYHRGFEINEDDKLANNVLFLNGPKWKLLRQNMTPLFTATKLKNMYYLMDKIGQDFAVYLKNNPKVWRGDCYNTVTMFCNASVCAAIFGISSESIFDSPFLKMAKSLNEPTLTNNLKFAVMNVSPFLTKLLGVKVFDEYEKFFIDTITKIIRKRENENIKMHDFADLCVNIRNNGKMKDSATGYEIEPSFDVLSAQAMFFLIAGVEPVAIVIFTTLVELGRHPDILDKVHREIDWQFEKNNNVMSYDAISEMTYVDKVLTESMRINPPIGTLSRQCVRETVLPVGDIKIEKGTKIFTPIYQIHHNPEFYPNPDVFDPERFANGCKIGDDLYMPFGMGGRMCIGARYSKLQVASSLVHVLRHFTVKTKELGGQKFRPHINSVTRTDVDVEFIPRNIK